MKGYMVKFFAVIIFLSLIACGPKPLFYKSLYGMNVYCTSRANCYSSSQVDLAINTVIDELVQSGSLYTYDKIFKFLNDEDGFHNIHFVMDEIGPEGSCATAEDSQRRCHGFKCGLASPNGWCLGLHHVKNYCYYNLCNALSNLKVAVTSNCLATTALVHELIHFFQFHIGGISDIRHEDISMWPSACTAKYKDLRKRAECKKKTVVNLVNWNLYGKVCHNTNKGD